MGYADTTELVACLNLLLEAERAGARVALATRRESADLQVRAFMESLGKDEAHWCAVLKTAVENLGAVPSAVCGDFFDKAMAIADPVERLVFLNRGQAWVVRKIEALLPRVRDDALHAALRQMAENHVANIAGTETMVEQLRS